MNKNCKYSLHYFTGHRNYSDANILNPKLSNNTRFCSNRQLPYFHNVDVDANQCTFSAFNICQEIKKYSDKNGVFVAFKI